MPDNPMTMPPTEPMFDVPPVPALGETLADPGPLPEDFEPAGYGDTPVTIRAGDAEALLVLAQRSPGVREVASAMDVLGRVSEAVSDALIAASPAASSPAPEPPGRLARIEVKGFRDLGVVRVTEVTFAGEPMVHAERTPWSLPGFEGDAADFPASSLHFVTWLPDAWPVVGDPGPKRAITGGDFRDFAGSEYDDGSEDASAAQDYDGPF